MMDQLPPGHWSHGGRRGLNLLHQRRDGPLEPAELAVEPFDHFCGPLGDRESATNDPRDLDLAGRGPALHFQLVTLPLSLSAANMTAPNTVLKGSWFSLASFSMSGWTLVRISGFTRPAMMFLYRFFILLFCVSVFC